MATRAINADPVVVHRQVQLARSLQEHPATSNALAAGLLSSEHAAVIVRAIGQLPAGVSSQRLAVIETALVVKARTMPPGLLRRAARRALAEVEPDPAVVDAHENTLVANEEAAARSRTRLSLHDNGDGTVASEAQVGPGGPMSTDWARARGEALCELIEHLPTGIRFHPRR